MEIDLGALKDVLTQTRTVPELCAAAAALGLSAAEQTVYGARNVEQRQWHIQLWVADLADPYGQRIHTRRPEVGPWSVTDWLTGRLTGALPGVVAGASPAYDLATYPASVAALEVHLLADSLR